MCVSFCLDLSDMIYGTDRSKVELVGYRAKAAKDGGRAFNWMSSMKRPHYTDTKRMQDLVRESVHKTDATDAQ